MTYAGLDSAFKMPEVLSILFLDVDQNDNKIDVVLNFFECGVLTLAFSPGMLCEDKIFEFLKAGRELGEFFTLWEGMFKIKIEVDSEEVNKVDTFGGRRGGVRVWV